MSSYAAVPESGAGEARPRCESVDPDLFFIDPPRGRPRTGGKLSSEYKLYFEQIERAKAICHACPVYGRCRERNYLTRSAGIWYGTTEAERRSARAKLEEEETMNDPERRTKFQKWLDGIAASGRAQSGVAMSDALRELEVPLHFTGRNRRRIRPYLDREAAKGNIRIDNYRVYPIVATENPTRAKQVSSLTESDRDELLIEWAKEDPQHALSDLTPSQLSELTGLLELSDDMTTGQFVEIHLKRHPVSDDLDSDLTVSSAAPTDEPEQADNATAVTTQNISELSLQRYQMVLKHIADEGDGKAIFGLKTGKIADILGCSGAIAGNVLREMAGHTLIRRVTQGPRVLETYILPDGWDLYRRSGGTKLPPPAQTAVVDSRVQAPQSSLPPAHNEQAPPNDNPETAGGHAAPVTPAEATPVPSSPSVLSVLPRRPADAQPDEPDHTQLAAAILQEAAVAITRAQSLRTQLSESRARERELERKIAALRAERIMLIGQLEGAQQEVERQKLDQYGGPQVTTDVVTEYLHRLA